MTALFFLAQSTNAAVAANDIRDIRGPIHIVTIFDFLFWILVGILSLALLFFIVRWLFRKRKAPPKLKTPHQKALEALEAAKEWIDKNRAKEFSYSVTEIIRNYIETRFLVRAARKTTEEFLTQILNDANTPLSAHRDLLQNFLNQCDMVKYANSSLAKQEMLTLLDVARQFVEHTVPPPEIKT